MELNNDWLEQKYNRIDELTEDFSISKYNLMKISFLKRLFEESLKRRDTCKTCAENLTELEELIEEIPFLDDIEHRQPYEKIFNAIRKHFHKEHHFIPPYYYSTRWTIGGVLAGVCISIPTSFFVNGAILIDPVLAGSALGLIVGYLVGTTREAKYRNSKKII